MCFHVLEVFDWVSKFQFLVTKVNGWKFDCCLIMTVMCKNGDIRADTQIQYTVLNFEISGLDRRVINSWKTDKSPQDKTPHTDF